MKQELHLIYGLTHPDAPGMGVLYVGSDRLSGDRVEQHRAGRTKAVGRGCTKFGLDPALLEAHILTFWRDGSPENDWMRELRSHGQAEFNKVFPYALSSADCRRGGRIGWRNQPREAKQKGGRISGPIQGRRAVESGHLASICTKGGRKAVESGQLDRIRSKDACSKGGRIGARNQPREAKAKGGRKSIALYGNPGTPEGSSKGGRRNVESGHLASIRTKDSCSKGGRIAGRKAAESGQLASVSSKGGRRHNALYGNPGTPEGSSKGGRKGARNQPREAKVKGGRVSGRKAVESGQLAGISGKGAHQRWHVARGVMNQNCALCQKGETKWVG